MLYVWRSLWFALLMLAGARALNRRTLVNEKPYDFAVNVAFGSLAGTAIVMQSVPVWGATLAMAAMTAFWWLVGLVVARSAGAARLLAGSPVPLVEGGRVVAQNLRRLHMTEDHLRAKLRELKVASVADVEYASLETDGRLGVVLRRKDPDPAPGRPG